MAKFMPLDGKKFGMLTVRKRAPNRGKHIYFLCRCECGNEKEIRNDKLTNGQVISCGCERRKRSDCRYDTKNSKLYAVYTSMKQRCFNKKCSSYHNYGGRGITVCNEWLGEEGYDNFRRWAISNGYHEAKRGEVTLDRVNVDGNYGPDNCRWITIQDQQNNTTRNIIIECGGEKHNLKEWSRIRGIAYSKIIKRLKSGWSIEETLGYKERHYGVE